jgi:hypothetical protein
MIGTGNVATGAGALFNNIDGGGNTATGANFTLYSNTHGNGNTATGDFTLASNIDGNFNTADGWAALSNNVSGSANTALGWNAGQGVTMASNVICIGKDVLGANVDNSCYIGNIYGQSIDPGTAAAVGVDSTGKLGTTVSSRRFKHDIKPMDTASEAILALKPVTFLYKGDAKDTPCFGLIAEEVAEVSPDLVVRDKEGKPYTVRYDQVNAMLLNEFLKEHRKNQEQEATIALLKSTVAQQQKQVEALTAGLQEVKAQVELSKPAPQVVNNP